MPADQKYKLNRKYRRKIEKGGTLVLGGGGVNEPDPVKIHEGNLDDVEPFVGEEWGMYDPDLLEQIHDEEVTDEDLDAVAAIVGDEPDEEPVDDEPTDEADDEPADDEESTEDESTEDEEPVDDEPADEEPTVPEDQDNLDRLPLADDEEMISEEPDIEEPEETPLHQLDDLDEEEVPTVEDLEDYTRDDLKEVARNLNVWRDIEGTGSNGYRQKGDIESYLFPLLEEYHGVGE